MYGKGTIKLILYIIYINEGLVIILPSMYTNEGNNSVQKT